MDDATLAELSRRVRELLRAKELPPAPRRLYGGTADGHQTCAVCGLTIQKDHIVFEFDIDEDERRRILFTHSDCYTVWHQQSEQHRN